MKLLPASHAILCLILTSLTTQAEDWPMWRHDVARTGSTSEQLATTLHRQWTRELPAPRPAWPASQFKLQFDASYEPVVAGGRMFVGSTVNDTITSYAVDTGKELWRFYTDGPVRFAPAVVDGRVYAVSDDGYLYCVNADTGELDWKYNGGPQHRPILGNGRLVSTWSARGGVVVDGGVAYFAAGIWPSMGVFVHAVDATTGERIWINSETSAQFITHPHGADSFGSISPQGALLVSGDNVIVPGGRTLPAVFDRETGKLKHFNFGGKGSGGHAVMAAGPFMVVRNQVMRTDDGAEIGTMFASYVADGHLLGTDAGGKSVVVTSVEGDFEDVEGKDRRGRKFTRTLFTPAFNGGFTPAVPGDIQLFAGDHLFLSAEGQISVYHIEDALKTEGEVQPISTFQMQGNVTSMLSANERLFVVTDNARIYCFGADKPNGAPTYELEASVPYAQLQGDVTEEAQELLEIAPMSGGYAVSLDADHQPLLSELLRQSEYQLIVLDDDPVQIDSFRRRMDTGELYGTRASAHVSDPFAFNLPQYLADLILRTEESTYSPGDVQTIFRSLRPYGGAACLRTSDEQHDGLVAIVEEADLENAEVTREGTWSVLRRVGALPDSGRWTHQYGDATNSVVSAEGRVKAPMGVLWFGGPANDKVLPRHGHGPSPQVVGGRLFIEGPDMLRCVDVYTGRQWWERDLPGLGAYYDNTAHHPGAGEIGSNYVSVEDHVYVVYGTELLELDARTGETTKTFSLKGDGSGAHWGGLAVSGDVLVVTADPLKVKGVDALKEAVVPEGAHAVVPPHAEWQYLGGSDPADNWTSLEFDDSKWQTGAAGFGYGDDDDRTVLNEMRGKYARLYARTTFEGSAVSDAASLKLMLNFDDAFIAYLNGTEIARMHVGEGNGADAKLSGSHEAEGYESYPVANLDSLLRSGTNVLAIEGHNDGPGSSDFSLDPYLIGVPARESDAPPNVAEFVEPTRYSTSSGQLVAFDRHTGSELWRRPAAYSYRHNTVCLSDDMVYCVDGMTQQALAMLRRRGVSSSTAPNLLALDLHSGDVRWSTEENVFGTFLNYSAEHDILIQAGSAARDRAKDDIGEGMIAYRGTDGEVLWEKLDLKYSGPCLLLKDRIITNGNGGFAISLLTGEETGWGYTRMYGCNTAIGCQTMLTFRSGAAGYFDLENQSGTGNLGGFRSSCTSNLIPADGVLSAPDYTRTCLCAYQLQTSLAFVHMEDADSWTFNPDRSVETPLQSVGLNLGAPGDRRDADGVMWFEYPTTGGPSPDLDVKTKPKSPDWFVQHSFLSPDEQTGWITSSGATDLTELEWDVEDLVEPGTYTVRLIFAASDSSASEVAVTVEGESEMPTLAVEIDGSSVTQDITGVEIEDELTVTLSPAGVLSGIAIIAE